MQDLSKIEQEHLQANDVGDDGDFHYKETVCGETVATRIERANELLGKGDVYSARKILDNVINYCIVEA